MVRILNKGMRKEEIIKELTNARVAQGKSKASITHNLSVDALENGKNFTINTLLTYAKAVGYEVVLKRKR